MEHNLVWKADGRIIYAIIPDFQDRRCSEFKLIGLMDTPVLANEVVRCHNSVRHTTLVKSMGSG